MPLSAGVTDSASLMGSLGIVSIASIGAVTAVVAVGIVTTGMTTGLSNEVSAAVGKARTDTDNLPVFLLVAVVLSISNDFLVVVVFVVVVVLVILVSE